MSARPGGLMMMVVQRAASTARFAAFLALLTLVLAGVSPALAQQQQPQLPQSVAELVRVREDVYAFRYLNHVSLFVPTDEGVVVVDPIGGGGNPQAPVALKAAIASITPQPVKFLVYSHAAPDHGTGGAVFSDTATFVSHANAKAAFESRNDPTSPAPTVTFDKTMPLDLGGKHFELHWAGITEQTDYLIFAYPAQKVIMTVDLGRIRTLPFSDLPQASPEAFVAFLERVDQSFDFEVVLSGHGPQANIWGTRQDLQDHRQYYLDLMAAIRDARAAGHADNSEAMIAAVRTALTPRYGSWANFQNGLAANISGVVRWWSM
ncbi:MAG: MBL fold metallo-hydrolase [Chloroflexi bacterium]|nr:MBL fold metallo-hydrolase [Chloroflexota bacterium]